MLVVNKIFYTLVDFETAPKFKLLEDSMQEDLIPYSKKKNYMQIYRITQFEVHEYDQIFVIDFICI